MPGAYLWAWDGTNWQPLLVEAAALKNLRVKLYDGVNPITAEVLGSIYSGQDTRYFLKVLALQGMYATSSSIYTIRSANKIGDNDSARYMPPAALWGFNGTTWDRLRVDTDKNLKVATQFSGNVYSKTMTMTDDNPTRFETTAKKLRDVVIIVQTHGMLLGETGVEVYPVGANETIGFTKVDISTLYFKNASAGDNGKITILGVEE